MFCHVCGRLNSEGVSVCPDCGAELKVAPIKSRARVAETPQVDPREAAPVTRTELYEAVIGPNNQDYYLQRFLRFDKARQTGASWHWPAFFVTFYWLLYRKMWLYALVYFFLPGIVTSLIGAFAAAGLDAGLVLFATGSFYLGIYLLPPMYANALYYRHCNAKIDETAVTTRDPQRQLGELSAKGGTSGVIVVLIFIVLFIAIVGILAAIAIPAYQDYVARSRMVGIVNYGTAATQAVTDYYSEHETMPPTLSEAGFDTPLPQGVNGSHVDGRAGVISLTLGFAPLNGKAVTFVPSFDADHQLTWRCMGQNMADKYLPMQCRQGR